MGKSNHSDKIFQETLDFLEKTCSNYRTTSRMHYEGGTGQKAPLTAYLTVGLQFTEP